jgi:hypothetical protein
MSLLSPMLVTLKTASGSTRQADLAVHMDNINLPLELQAQGAIPVDVYEVYTMGWLTAIPNRTDYLVDQATNTKYSMFSTVFHGHDGLQFRVSKYSGSTP